jgi:hypothetical protein
VPALGEDAAGAEAHCAAVRAELGAEGPVARHLAETVACSMLRASRAERLEGELLGGLAEGGRSAAAALHADRDARATLALLQRYRREADGELRRSLDALVRLRRAREDGLLPDAEAAGAAREGLDAALADLPAPSEPRIEKIESLQRVAPPANDDRRAAEPAPPARKRDPAQLLRWYRFERGWSEERGARCWAGFTPEERASALAAAEEERRAREEGRDPASLHAAVADRLAG